MTTSVSNATEVTAPSGFAALNLSEPVLRAIDEVGYTEPTPVQAATYPVAITGRDIIVQARTGTGKTAAFGIPLVDKLVTADPWVQALVLAPTRELAVQSQRELARLAQYKGLHTVAIYGGAPMGRQIDELKSGAQLVSGTPGRVLDHLRRGTLEPGRLKVLVLDEMDEMLSMGFAKELNAILEMLPPKGRRQTMCFSATVDGEIRRHAERHMHEPEMISLSSDAVSAAQITHQVYMVSGRDRIGDLVRVLEVEDPDSAIVFCNMRSETERVATGLKLAGFNADWLNGDLPQKDRERIMSSTREGKLRYLVATDVAARGIDISHLTHVINFTFPESAAVYVHRTGRTGRAGRTGCAISLVGPEELGRLYYLRLEYKISPVERSLPTHGELKTRQEIDRIGLLEAAFAARPNPNDLSVARRLLTHPENERILAGLLHTFFGTKDDADEEAAAARRSKPGPDLEQADRAARERERFTSRDRGSRERDDRGRPGERERDRDDRGRSRDRDRDRSRDSARPPRDRESSGEARDSEARRDREPRNRDREARPREREGVSPNEHRDREAGREPSSGTDREPRNRDRESSSAGGRERENGVASDRNRDPRNRNRESVEVYDLESGASGDREASGEARSRDRERKVSGETRERSRNRDSEAAGEARNPRDAEAGGDHESAPQQRERSGEARRSRERDRDRASARGRSGEALDDAAAGRERTDDGAREERSQRRARGSASGEANGVSQAPDGDDARDNSAADQTLARDRTGARERDSGRASSRERGRGRDRGLERRDERPARARDAGVQGELLRDEGSADEDSLLSASEARTPGDEASARSAARKQRPARETDGELFSPEREGEQAAEAGTREEGAASSGRRKRKRSRDRKRERSSDASQPSAADDANQEGATSDDAPRTSERPARSRTARAEGKPRAAVDGELLPAEANGADEGEHEQAEATEPLEGLLYLNLGKRDGLLVPEVARLLRDSCELSRGQIGRIRLRDRYTFVDVPEGRLDGIIATLSGQVVHDKPLAPERAKTTKS